MGKATDHAPPLSVIIPAHNEEAVIARCISGLLENAPEDHNLDIIIAANGCSDRTVEIAQSFAPSVRVLDLHKGSKTAAINAANDIALHFPRIYLDADVECSYATIAALAKGLVEPGIMVAAPAIKLDLSRLDPLARAYYRAWLRQPYAKAGKGGAGCYGLSRAAHEIVGRFPPIIADDLWIHTRFPDTQKRHISYDVYGQEVFTIVHPPRTLREQVNVETRRYIGNQDLKADYPSPYLSDTVGEGGLKAAFASGASAFDLAIFLGVKLAARVNARHRRARGQGKLWTRDLSSRGA